jgi:formylglycine-generating enzyme
MPRLCSTLLLLIASSASAVPMAWTPIGDPANACDPLSQGCFGAVGYGYAIGTYEVTNAQYAEFLNAKAAADPYGLYNGSGMPGIARNGSSGSYTYGAISGSESKPVSVVSFYDALRFANWLSNGQGAGDTETGSYTLLGGTAIPSNTDLTRNPNATIVLATEDEWYKAAYYNALGTSYFDYPAGSDIQTSCTAATATPNRANCNFAVSSNTLAVGSYSGSPSPYGSFDQGGNVAEWLETPQSTTSSPWLRLIRGGSWGDSPSVLAGSVRGSSSPQIERASVGFRLVLIPEPSTGLLVIAGLLGLVGRRRGRA